MNVDAIKLNGDTLKCVNKDVNDEEKLHAELYKELEGTDRRISRTCRRGRGRGRGHSTTSSIGAKEKGKGKQAARGRGKGRVTIT